jgi:hypothetical protein
MNYLTFLFVAGKIIYLDGCINEKTRRNKNKNLQNILSSKLREGKNLA